MKRTFTTLAAPAEEHGGPFLCTTISPDKDGNFLILDDEELIEFCNGLPVGAIVQVWSLDDINFRRDLAWRQMPEKSGVPRVAAFPAIAPLLTDSVVLIDVAFYHMCSDYYLCRTPEELHEILSRVCCCDILSAKVSDVASAPGDGRFFKEQDGGWRRVE